VVDYIAVPVSGNTSDVYSTIGVSVPSGPLPEHEYGLGSASRLHIGVVRRVHSTFISQFPVDTNKSLRNRGPEPRKKDTEIAV
jgi:hypothetical protein